MSIIRSLIRRYEKKLIIYAYNYKRYLSPYKWYILTFLRDSGIYFLQDGGNYGVAKYSEVLVLLNSCRELAVPRGPVQAALFGQIGLYSPLIFRCLHQTTWDETEFGEPIFQGA